jgi:alpha-galactosidase
LGVALAALSTTKHSAKTVWLDTLNLSAATQGRGEPQNNKSVDGTPLTISGQAFARGFGTHAVSRLRVKLAGGAQSFSANKRGGAPAAPGQGMLGRSYQSL